MPCKKTCAGQLRYQIQVFNRTLQATNCEADIQTALKYTVRADIKVRDIVSSGILTKQGININEVVTHTFTIRFKSDLNDDDIIRYNDKYYKIVGFIDPDERKRFLRIHCIERGAVTDSRNLV